MEYRLVTITHELLFALATTSLVRSLRENFDAKTSSGSMKNAVSPVSLDDPPNSGVGEVAAT